MSGHRINNEGWFHQSNMKHGLIDMRHIEVDGQLGARLVHMAETMMHHQQQSQSQSQGQSQSQSQAGSASANAGGKKSEDAQRTPAQAKATTTTTTTTSSAKHRAAPAGTRPAEANADDDDQYEDITDDDGGDDDDDGDDGDKKAGNDRDEEDDGDEFDRLGDDTNHTQRSVDTILDVMNAIYVAARSGQSGALRDFLEISASTAKHLAPDAPPGMVLNLQDPSDGSTVLHRAIEDGDLHAAAFLLKHGADPNVQAWDGATPLHLAGTDMPFIELLFTNKATPMLTPSRQVIPTIEGLSVWDDDAPISSPAFHQLVGSEESSYSFDAIRRYVRENRSVLQVPDTCGCSPLHAAVVGQRLQHMQLLLSLGANINAYNIRFLTPLASAIMCGTTKATCFLLRHGASVDMPEIFQQLFPQTFGCSPIHMLLVPLMHRDPDDESKPSGVDGNPSLNLQALMTIFRHHPNAINTIVTREQETPLYLVVAGILRFNPSLQCSVASRFLVYGANVDACGGGKNAFRMTALQAAIVFANNPALLRLLLAASSMMDAPYKHGLRLLHIASDRYAECGRVLLAANADVNACSFDLLPPIYVHLYGDGSLVPDLCARGISHEPPKNFACDFTPLGYAARCCPESVGHILSASKDAIQGLNRSRMNALQCLLASHYDPAFLLEETHRQERQNAAELLLASDSINHIAGAGRSSLHLAIIVGSPSHVDLALKHQTDHSVKDVFGLSAFQYVLVMKKLSSKLDAFFQQVGAQPQWQTHLRRYDAAQVLEVIERHKPGFFSTVEFSDDHIVSKRAFFELSLLDVALHAAWSPTYTEEARASLTDHRIHKARYAPDYQFVNRCFNLSKVLQCFHSDKAEAVRAEILQQRSDIPSLALNVFNLLECIQCEEAGLEARLPDSQCKHLPACDASAFYKPPQRGSGKK
ncbi:hypothetical protein CAOG_00243 [Capsaspora owczarzaki ATCC 30864]|uniref:Uncharacterized protein n=1 Tax=Capsaspora owczarzaki (strain ATCC 30864) TaxID=595528 RepID=A0A0D2U0B3_CAPO3|nr:hypothetical protein CAOG_00243 [Capsaspora owczarzaki ATCC 30864]KJE88616.1 hypothetical protein CAOG_000243 [Capsaspora owczarzaki ATCC 30864]|eukprot:XP_004365114.2 hypothetical protein CAOG_00243 [Capsaspora owczarzaki ATCC 30864]